MTEQRNGAVCPLGQRTIYDRPMAKLFISHASHDKRLVEAVVDLLEGGVGVPHSDFLLLAQGSEHQTGSPRR
jgi:hypothetical protein